MEVTSNLPPAAAVVTPLREEESWRCFHCGSTTPFYTDVAQGDVICTLCGVVQAESILDSSPEWREYADDTGGANANKSRCGMVPTDESKYLGGLEPTRLSSVPFGGGACCSSDSTRLRHTLSRAQHRTEAFLLKSQKRAWESAEVAVEFAKKKMASKKQKTVSTIDDDDKKPDYDTATDTELEDQRPNFDLVVVEEDEEDSQPELMDQVRQLEVQRRQLYAEKWSLKRALSPTEEVSSGPKMKGKEEKALRKAAATLRDAYAILKVAAESQPKTLLENAASRLEQYAVQRDGLPKDTPALAAALIGRPDKVSGKAYKKAVKELQKYNLYRAATMEDWLKPLDLPTTAEAVIVHLAQQQTKATTKKAHSAALTYLVSAAGARAQQWAGAADASTVAWDSWREELEWSRSPSSIAKSFGVTETQLRQQFTGCVFPERHALLQRASDSSTPLKSVLLPQLLAAAATLKATDFEQVWK